MDSVRELLNIYLHPHPKYRRPLPSFDYSLIRPAGSPIKGFGGTSQGTYEPHHQIDSICNACDEYIAINHRAWSIEGAPFFFGNCAWEE